MLSIIISIVLGVLSVILGGLALYIAIKIVNINSMAKYSEIYSVFAGIQFKMWTLEMYYSGTQEVKKLKQEIFNGVMSINRLIISTRGSSTVPEDFKGNSKFLGLLSDSGKIVEYNTFMDDFMIKLLISNNMIVVSTYNDLKEYRIKYLKNWYCQIIGFTEIEKINK